MTVRSESGVVLIITLLVLAIITAVVVEFAYGVYFNTAHLQNWQEAGRLSLAASSGVTLASRFITDVIGRVSYTYPSSVELPAYSLFEEGAEKVLLRVEDESSKFNVNTIVYSNNDLNPDAYNSFRRLLSGLGLEETLADAVADWIDKDETPRLADSERDAKNAALDGLEEIPLIPGITLEIYDKLKPYITVFGRRDILSVNINGAGAPVLMALHPEMDAELAGRVIGRRELKPFENAGDIVKVPGFEKKLGADLIKYITVKGEFFRVVSTAASEDGLKIAVECVLDQSGTVKYWREF